MKNNLKLRVTNTQNKVFNVCNKQIFKKIGMSWEREIAIVIPNMVAEVNRNGNALINSVYKKYRR